MADAIERKWLADAGHFFLSCINARCREGVHDKAKEGVELALLGPLTEVTVAERGSGEDILRLAAELDKVLPGLLLSRREGG